MPSEPLTARPERAEQAFACDCLLPLFFVLALHNSSQDASGVDLFANVNVYLLRAVRDSYLTAGNDQIRKHPPVVSEFAD